MWIARDKDGELWVFGDKPFTDRCNTYWTIRAGAAIKVDKKVLPEVTFENSPKEVELKLKKK